MRCEDTWGRPAGMRRFGWRPTVELSGLEHLRAALERRRGAILWCIRFASATALKQGLYYAGHAPVHLSHAQHGSQSKTTLGVQVVAPLYCRAENPYLAERVVIPLDGSLAYLKRLRHKIRSNACVSIFGEHDGRSAVEANVLGMSRKFAVGAPSLAWSEGAALLLAYPLRTGPFRYKLAIEPEIPVDGEIERKRFASQAVSHFAARLEQLIIENPADWQGWSYPDLSRVEDAVASAKSVHVSVP